MIVNRPTISELRRRRSRHPPFTFTLTVSQIAGQHFIFILKACMLTGHPSIVFTLKASMSPVTTLWHIIRRSHTRAAVMQYVILYQLLVIPAVEHANEAVRMCVWDETESAFLHESRTTRHRTTRHRAFRHRTFRHRTIRHP